MTQRVTLVRHAQGFHNLSVANHVMHDPMLTDEGKAQCHALAENFPYNADIDLIVASPLKRTIWTALLSFEGPIKKKNLKIIALPELQETSDLPCDTGSDPSEVMKEFDGKPVDLSRLEGSEGATWNSKKGKWAIDSPAIVARARESRQWLMNRPEKNIVVVTHGGFLHYFTEDWEGNGKFEGTGWANTEFRSYTFNSGGSFVETLESQKLRAGTDKPLSKEESKNISRTTQEDDHEKAKNIQAKV